MRPLFLLYQALGTVGFLLALPWIVIRSLGHRREMRERLGGGLPELTGSGPIWIHAASLGELEGVRALLEGEGRRLRPPVHVSVLSVSARDRAQEMLGHRATVGFAPLDLWFCYDRVLSRVRPRGVILLETELWPGFLQACSRRKIPVAVISGRLSLGHWRGTRRMRPLLAPLLRRVSVVGAQSEGDAERFRELGASRVVRTGNLKYRTAGAVSDSGGPRTPRIDPGLLLVAGSIRKGEEQLLEVSRLRGLTLVAAPRHLREREHWIESCSRAGLDPVLRSEIRLDLSMESIGRNRVLWRAEIRRRLQEIISGNDKPRRTSGHAPRVLLIDTHGELLTWYQLADAAFVGGTMVPIGGHNLYEPAREGVPTAFGPHTANVEDVAESLLSHGGGRRISDLKDLESWCAHLMKETGALEEARSGARAAAAQLEGSVERTWELLESLRWPGVAGEEGADR